MSCTRALPPDAETPALSEMPLLLYRRDPARRMARWYALSVEITLFEDWSCTRSHGRIGRRGGRVIIGLHADRAAAEAALGDLLRRKLARGYRCKDG